MRTIVIAALALAVMAPAALPAAASSHEALAIASSSAQRCVVTQVEFRSYARAVYWRSKVSKQAARRMDVMRGCAASRKASRNMLAFQRAQSVQRRLRLELLAITPFIGPGGTRWAIPWKVVWCESSGRWRAANASGAVGPYQLLGHGAIYPASTRAAKMQNHRIARRLYLASRLGPWTASRHCWG